MTQSNAFYIGGEWVKPYGNKFVNIVQPSTEEICAILPMGTPQDVDNAVAAAKEAFPAWSATSPETRLSYVKEILKLYEEQAEEFTKAISLEMGAPIDFAREAQFAAAIRDITGYIKAFANFEFERPLLSHLQPKTVHNGEAKTEEAKNGRMLLQPIGVVGLITPWNWPVHQVALKVVAALLAGCTMVLKPSEIAPLSANLFAKILAKSGLPAGVFNLVHGTGENVGAYLCAHKDIAMISFTGSTRAGKSIARQAGYDLKRVALELGGKGANIIFADADEDAVARGTDHCFYNSGQSCNAPSRMLIERPLYEKALQQAKQQAEKTKLDYSHKSGNHLGPIVSKKQYEHVLELIQSAIDEGAKLLIGGVERPQHLPHGYFVQPTIFYDVTPSMRIFREEVFGPVLAMTPFDTIEEAIELANDTDYGLTNYIQSQDLTKCKKLAEKLNSGMVQINGAFLPCGSFFGGVKHSGNAREGGYWGIREFLHTKASTL